MSKPTDITGQRFGLLTALIRVGSKHSAAVWRCRCDCGEVVEARVDFLKSGKKLFCDWRKHDPARSGHITTAWKLGLDIPT